MAEIKRNQVLKPFEDEKKKVKEQRFIANLRGTRANVKRELLVKQLTEMAKLALPSEKPDTPVIHYQRINTVKVEFPKTELKTKDDVEKI